jgi:hypothetical protein
MHKNRILKLSTMAASALMVCGSLLLANAASAEYCSNTTLLGAYGYHAEGALSPAPNLTLTFRSVGMTRFDGSGHVSWVEHTVIGGVSLGPGFTPAKGTYTVNSNCTGSAVINTPNSPVPLVLYFVVEKDGKLVHSVLNTDAVNTEFTKVDD